jgi:hypothetical protein
MIAGEVTTPAAKYFCDLVLKVHDMVTSPL